jgi:hypothetical protein
MRVAGEQFTTEGEYWLLEEQPEIRHEYFNGEIFAMTGGSAEHPAIPMKMGAALLG